MTVHTFVEHNPHQAVLMTQEENHIRLKGNVNEEVVDTLLQPC